MAVSVDKDAPTGYHLYVGASAETDQNVEDVRFCAGDAEGHSNSTRNKAIEIGATMPKNSGGCIHADFDSEGGTLKIYQDISDSDVRMNTSRGQGGVLNGAVVYFSLEHTFTRYIKELVQAILTDMQPRPK